MEADFGAAIIDRAACLSQHLRNFLRSMHLLRHMFYEFKGIQSSFRLLHPGQKKSISGSTKMSNRIASTRDCSSTAEVLSTSGSDSNKSGENSCSHGDFPMISECFQQTGSQSSSSSLRKMCSCIVSLRKQRYLRSWQLPVGRIKPFSSMESCLFAQMHCELLEMKDYLHNLNLVSPATTVSPLFIAGDLLDAGLNRENVNMFSKEETDSICEVPLVTTNMPLGSPNKAKFVERMDRDEKINASRVSGKMCCSQGLILSVDHVRLLSLGISVGMIAYFLSNKEVYKLKESLSQIEDERSMGNESDVKGLEDMSKIETELQAELEKLEQSVELSSPERSSSHVFKGNEDGGVSSGENSPCAFSPRDLRMRLQEVLQERLEERIKELEAALHNSQMKVHQLESKLKSHCSNFANDYSPSSRIEWTEPGSDISDSGILYDLCDSYCQGESDTSTSSDAESCRNSDTERRLIDQIIDKTRKGSLAVLNARRAFILSG